MIIIDDIKSLYVQLTGADMHEHIAFNELGYGRRVGDRIYVFCPYCKKILELDASQVTEEEDGRMRLEETVSCNCRKGLRYLRKGVLELDLKPAGSLETVRTLIQTKGDAYKHELEIDARKAAAQKEKRWEDGLRSLRDGSPERPLGSAAGTGLTLQGSYEDSTGQSAYIPDDFEPNMDPYDREALYEEEMLDDWVIAGGGNPCDFEDRVDAFSDPFGFHDDFGGGDGGFDGFGGGWGGFGGGDD